MDFELEANRYTYSGLFLITLSTLMYEILLTRIFSVITYYHFAFMAISIVMFGMTIGAMLVYLLPRFQNNKNIKEELAFASLLFSITIILSFPILLIVPLNFQLTIYSMLNTAFVYLAISIPFVFSGICVCLSLTKFKQQINSLYAADLIGAGLGCIAIILALNIFTGPTCVIVVAFFAACAAILFSINTTKSNVKASMMVFIFLFLMVITNTFLNHLSPWRLTWVKNRIENVPLYEKWNAFSRVTIVGNPEDWKSPFTQGLSDTYQELRKVHSLNILIDANAATSLLNYHHKPKEIDYLKYDITGFAHYLKSNAKVLIVGVGGGRDVLTGLAFNQSSILGVEINPIIIDILTNKFADYSGHLDKDPKVTLVNAEARSFISELQEKFDMIQISLIDTWAATAAGAYTLTENSLYTTEAWKIFLNHLNPTGILTVTRWYIPKFPGELYRLTALASQTLTGMGISDPAKHIMIFASKKSANNYPTKVFVGNIILSPTPFSKESILTAENAAKKLNFSILFTPQTTTDVLFTMLAANKKKSNSVLENLGLDMTAPTDDKPFFFEMLKFSKFLSGKLWNQNDLYLNNNFYISANHANTIMSTLLITVVVLTLLFVITPFLITIEMSILKSAVPLLIYFASIGLGFMFIEISQLQRLVLFLGTPTYGLSVVLFSLLVATGLGSLFASNNLSISNLNILSLLMILIVLGIFGAFTSALTTYFQASSTLFRIVVAIAILFPSGLCMGVALPLGMQFANNYSTNLAPYLWGMNGATSICASVFAMAIALTSGISITFWMGVLCYFIAFISYCYIVSSSKFQKPC